MSILNFKREGAEDLSTVPTWDAPDERVGKPSEHPLIRLAHAELGPGAIDEGGNRDRPLLDRISTAFTLGGKGDPDLGDGTGPDAGVLDESEKLGHSVPDGYGEKLEVLNRPAIKSPGFALRHAKDNCFEIPASEVGDRVLLGVRAEEVGVFLLEFAQDGRALRAMENVLVPGEGGQVGEFLSASDEGRAVRAKEQSGADSRFVLGPPKTLSFSAALGSIPCFTKVDSPGSSVGPLGLRKMETSDPV